MKYILREMAYTISDYTGIYDGTWEPGTVTVFGRNFEILVGKDETNIIIKPSPVNPYCINCKGNIKGYHVFEYEKLFGFGSHCSGFDLEKKVNITKAIVVILDENGKQIK